MSGWGGFRRRRVSHWMMAYTRPGVARLYERDQGELANVWYWMNRLGASISNLDEQLGGIRFMTRIAAGFIEELDGAFGIIVYTESPQSGGTDEEYGEPAQRLRAPISDEGRRPGVSGDHP